jgi:hypothetical protein
LRNEKWTSFLRTLRPQSSQFWKIARYFKKSSVAIPLKPIEERKFITPRTRSKSWPASSSSLITSLHILNRTTIRRWYHVMLTDSSTQKSSTSHNYNLRIPMKSNIRSSFSNPEPPQVKTESLP